MWEYKRISGLEFNKLESAGRNGWELVCKDSNWFYLKRFVEPVKPKAGFTATRK